MAAWRETCVFEQRVVSSPFYFTSDKKSGVPLRRFFRFSSSDKKRKKRKVVCLFALE
jgi:hypothetical protein